MIVIEASVCACATFVFGVNFPSVWLQKWTNYNVDHPNQEPMIVIEARAAYTPR
jgi:hypothetical protein